jgi:hypothetical protein
MLTIPGHKGNTKQNQTKIPSPVRIASIENSKNTNVGEDAGEKGAFIHCW